MRSRAETSCPKAAVPVTVHRTTAWHGLGQNQQILLLTTHGNAAWKRYHERGTHCQGQKENSKLSRCWTQELTLQRTGRRTFRRARDRERVLGPNSSLSSKTWRFPTTCLWKMNTAHCSTISKTPLELWRGIYKKSKHQARCGGTCQ